MNFTRFSQLLAGLALAAALLTSSTPQTPMSLPHNESLHDLPAQAAVERLRAAPEKDVHFAFSKDFYSGDVDFDKIYDAYHNFYERKKAELIKVLGQPSFDGAWVSEAFPIWAVGDTIASWGTGADAIYLRLHHEDKEMPIEVSLLSRQSPSSNHEPESIYEGLRKMIPHHEQ